jgi:hypothetical protein
MPSTRDAAQATYAPFSFSFLLSSFATRAQATDRLRHARHPPVRSQREHGSVAERRFDIVDNVADTLLWQTLASLLVPPLLINRTCKLTAFGLGKYFPPAAYPSLTPRRRALVQTAVGLAVIPFIVHPIDHGVHFALDHTSRALSGIIRRKYFPVPSSSPPLQGAPQSDNQQQQHE